MKYALIGKKLGHSFSKDIHNSLGLDYTLVELAEEEVTEFLKKGEYDGFNVTIPYKEKVFSAVDVLDDSAKSVGSVNTVTYKNGVSYGYNTDVGGMKYSLNRAGVDLKGKKVLITGSGGTSKTAQALCRAEGAEFAVCSRKGEINYDNVYEKVPAAEIIINCTPVGMYPDLDGRILDIGKFNNLILAADCIYNPLKTALLTDAEERGIKFVNGLPMLVAQAVYAEEIWLGKKIDTSKIDCIIADLTRKKSNITLIGMPGCGKTTVGKRVAEILGREFFDTDEIITKKYGSPEKIITEKGEIIFRDIESEVLSQITAVGGRVIATGGGAVLRRENINFMRRNGAVVYLTRELQKLATDGRPLSVSSGVEKLYEERKDLYKNACDRIIDNNGEAEKSVKEIISYYENFGY